MTARRRKTAQKPRTATRRARASITAATPAAPAPSPRDASGEPARATRYVLRLYVTGTTPASTRAVENVRELCETRLRGRYDLEVIDIYQLPALAQDQQIIATPTLIRLLPLPLRRFIGDLTRPDGVLFGLDLREKP